MSDHITRLQTDQRSRAACDFLDGNATFEVQGLLLLGGQLDHRYAQTITAALGTRTANIAHLLTFIRQCADGDRQFLTLAVANHFKFGLAAVLEVADQVRQVSRHDDWLAVGAQNHVTHLHTALGSRAIFKHLRNQRAGRLVQTKRLGEVLVHFLDDHTQPAAADFAISLELVGDIHGDVDRNRERQPHETTGAGEDLRVDPDDFASHVEQRATGVTRVDGHVGLNERHIGVVRQAAPLGTDDTLGHGVIETERRADRQNPFADLERIGIAQFGGRQVLAINFQHGNVGTRIGTDQFGLQLAAIGQAYENLVSAIDYVVVGQHVAIRGDDEARAEGLGLTLAITLACTRAWRTRTRRHAALEKLTEHRRQAFQIRHLLIGDGTVRQLLARTDIHHCGRCLLDQPGEVRQVFGMSRNNLTEHQHSGNQ